MHCLIIANGPAPSLEQIHQATNQADLVIAADGGTAHTLAAGLYPDLVVGDLDSLAPEVVKDLRAAEVSIIHHPARKNETDLELALHEAARRGATRITLLGAVGGRLDQTLSNIFLLTLPAFVGIPIRLLTADEEAFVVREQAHITGEVGDIVSLIPLTPRVEGVTTRGLEYPLENATLHFGPSLGISNELRVAEAEVKVSAGILLVIHGRRRPQPAPSAAPTAEPAASATGAPEPSTAKTNGGG